MIKKSIIRGIAGALFFPAIYLGITLLLTRSWPHSLERLETFKIWLLVFSFGFGLQLGLMKYSRLQCGKSMSAGMVMSGASGTFGMVACCLHHLSDFAVFSSSAGIAALSLKYQNSLLSIGLAANIFGSGYLILKIKNQKIKV